MGEIMNIEKIESKNNNGGAVKVVFNRSNMGGRGGWGGGEYIILWRSM